MRGVQVEGLALGALETNCWLVADGDGGPLVVIDPAGDAGLLLRAIAPRKVAAVVLTHGHFDHLGAAAALVAATGAPLAVHTLDAGVITDARANGGLGFGFEYEAPAADRRLEDGDVVQAGNLTLTVLHTPGHTPGSICLFAESAPGVVDPHLFSGDTLFARSVGRTDFPGGDARALARSIAAKLVPLPSETQVHPGHGPDTTIGHEARVNPFWPR
ncbi:MAG: MBL fold metallo-hydrolase [Coriobacteriia bacterium]|nr:MBL fold metallo-hydrolase [Coriobacteriia bacterium]